jgi:phosphohistidine phosphatase
MKTLLLIRHAKSSWATAGTPDHDRPLNERGRRDAPEMGNRLRTRGIEPDLIVCSSALRARTTAQLLAAALDVPQERLREDPRIYASSSGKLMYLLQELDDELSSVMLVGHNPEMTELAQHFASDLPDMATTAVAQFTFDLASWRGIDQAEPLSVWFDYPKSGED